MIMSDLISIIVPAYNIEKYLERCVESLLKQSYSNIEIILVDDGSTDSTAQLCDYYGKNYNQITVIHKTNGGLSDARNVGLDVSSGKYVSFVDSDDWIATDMIESLYNVLKQTNTKLVVCEPIYAYADYIKEKNFSGKSFVLNQREAIESLVSDRVFRTNAWNKLYDINLWEDVRFPIGKKYEDVHIMHEIYCKCEKIAFLDRGLYYYFQRNDSIVHVPNLESYMDFVYGTIQRYNYLFKKYEDMEPRLAASVISSILVVYRNIGINKLNVKKFELIKLKQLFVKYDNKKVYIFLSPRFKIDYLIYKISPLLFMGTSGIIQKLMNFIKK